MESLYKKKLLELKNATEPDNFGQALFDHMNWSFQKIQQLEIPEKKIEIIKEFSEFAHKTMEEQNTQKIVFDGVEVTKKPHSSEIKTDNLNRAEFLQRINEVLPKSDIELRYLHKTNIKVLFVFDRYQVGLQSKLNQNFEKALNLFLSEDSVDLFAKMVMAMKLNPEEILLSSIFYQKQDQSEDYLKYLNQEIMTFKPKLVITLGAEPAMRLLNTKEGLGQNHGKFTTYFVGSDEVQFETQVMPLFHPELLKINTNMKRTAWEDMQKAMKFINQ